MPWMPVHNCKKPVLVCRVLCFITTWTMYCWCYACFSNLHVLFYLVSPSLLFVIFFIAQCNPIICMMIKEDNKVSVFCILYSILLASELHTGIFLMLSPLRPRWNRWHFADDIFKFISWNEYILRLIKISLKFIPKGPINNIPALVS